MSDKKTENTAAGRGSSQPVRKNRLFMPDSLPASIGAQFADERHAQGVVTTENIPALLETFGLTDEKHVPIPFQRIRHVKGDQYELRIENAAGHVVDGAPIVGHQWQYRQTLPERTA